MNFSLRRTDLITFLLGTQEALLGEGEGGGGRGEEGVGRGVVRGGVRCKS